MKNIIFFTLLFFLFASHTIGSASENTYTFGIVPQQQAHKLNAAWQPIMDYLEQKTGDRYVFATAPSIPEFEKRCALGQYDIAYMNPYHYTVFSQNPGYRAIANQANKRIQGIMVIRKDSSVKNLGQLKEKPLAFPSPAAFAASILTQSYFSQQNIPIQPHYVYSHDKVYKSVAAGDFLAGGGIRRTFNKVSPEIRKQLKILWTTDKFTPHAFAAHPNLDKQVIERLQNSLIQMHDNEEGRGLLGKIGFKSIQSAQDSDWDDIRALNIDILDNLVKK